MGRHIPILILSEDLHMTTVIINENQNGLLFKNGKYQKTVGAGKYRLFGGRTMEILEQGKLIDSKYCALDTLLAHPDFAKLVSTVEVGDEQIALHFVNGSFRCAIARPGKYAFRNGGDTHEFRMVDISAPEVPADFPRYILDRMQPGLYKTVEVAAYQKARLFFDNKFVRLLEPGTYAFWNGGVKVDVDFVDTRLLQMDITGQEIMTQDKVALRINFVCSYRITDYVRILTEIDNYVEQLHIAAQLGILSANTGWTRSWKTRRGFPALCLRACGRRRRRFSWKSKTRVSRTSFSPARSARS